MRRSWTEYEEAWLELVWPKTEILVEAIAYALKRTVPAIYHKTERLGIVKRRNYYWTKYEDVRLKKMWIKTEIPIEAISLSLKRTVNAIKNRIHNLGLERPSKGWTEHEDEWLKLVYPKTTDVQIEAIADVLKRTVSAIRGRAHVLRVKRPPDYTHALEALKRWTNSPEGKAHWKRVQAGWIGSPEQKEHLKRQGERLLSSNTSMIEGDVEEVLDERGLRYLRHIDINRKFHPDFFLPDYNTIIEVDGCYWHGCKTCGMSPSISTRGKAQHVYARTKSRNAYFRKLGYNLVIVPEHEKKDGYPTLMNFLDSIKPTLLEALRDWKPEW